MPLTREEAVELLTKTNEQLAKVSGKDETLQLLSLAGKSVGYKPAFRALVMGMEPEKAIKW